ncbi:MAG: hypothetical protein KA120_04225 [Candidatus Goldbacteria bacterium]|nr:hypothetical protein [Candidatus Goldiibacteriota bacterium]
MKRIFILLITFLFSVNFLFSATVKKKAGKEKFEIKNAQDIVEYLEKHGLTGSEIKEGVMAKIFRVITLRDYRGIYNKDKYSVAIWDFEKSYGFNIAVSLFQLLTLFTDTAVYKDRPYIISIEGNKTEQQKIIDKLESVLPTLMEIGEKEY